MIRIAHLSDPHLDNSTLRLRRLERVLAEVSALADVDLVLVSGDVADHGTADEYEQFFEALDVISPTMVLPGNHDLRGTMSKHVPAAAGGFLNQVHCVNGLTIIGLDSLIEHHDEGLLTQETLEFARSAMIAADGPVVLALHHPPIPVGHSVMDRFGLENAETLAEVVNGHDGVVAVLTGHVHTALSTTFAGNPLVGAPGIVSTMRLGSRTDPIADPAAMPGFALHTFRDDGHLTSIFHYLSPEPLE